MRLGIFAKTFARRNFEEVFDAIKNNGLSQMQFNMVCAGLPTLPDYIDANLADRIRKESLNRGLNIAAISGTYNMIHPNREERELGLKRLKVLAGACSKIGTTIITLCTGTRNETGMWKKHRENDSADAWHDLCISMAGALRIVEEHRVTLAIEPEISNVVNNAAKARRLLDEMQSPFLKVVMDGANLFHPGEANHMIDVLDKAFDILGSDIVIAHAKDLADDEETSFVAAGKGILDYTAYIKHLRDCNFHGALILHGLSESQVPESVGFIRERLDKLDREE
jgi:sugar phosphate isomerase/epimerase